MNPNIIYVGTVDLNKNNYSNKDLKSNSINNTIDNTIDKTSKTTLKTSKKNKKMSLKSNETSNEKSTVEYKMKQLIKQIKIVESELNKFKNEPIDLSQIGLYKSMILNINVNCNSLYNDIKTYIDPNELIHFIQQYYIIKDKCKQLIDKSNKLNINAYKSLLIKNDTILNNPLNNLCIKSALNCLELGPDENKSVEELLKQWKQYEDEFEMIRNHLRNKDQNDPLIKDQLNDVEKDWKDLKNEYQNMIKKKCNQRNLPFLQVESKSRWTIDPEEEEFDFEEDKLL